MSGGGQQRFRAALGAAGLEDTVVGLEMHARTAEQAAAALGCQVGQIVKSLVFIDAAGDGVLVLAAGDVRVDERRVAHLHGTPVQLADPRSAHRLSGYAIGGVPPFGHDRPLPTLVDRTLLRHPEIWAAAGTPRHVFRITLRRLLDTTGGQLEEVGRAPA